MSPKLVLSDIRKMFLWAKNLAGACGGNILQNHMHANQQIKPLKVCKKCVTYVISVPLGAPDVIAEVLTFKLNILNNNTPVMAFNEY